MTLLQVAQQAQSFPDWNFVMSAVIGALVGGAVTLLVTRLSIRETVAVNKAERKATGEEHRLEALRALEAELRINATAVQPETDRLLRAMAWRLPFRDASVAALPHIATLPDHVRLTIQRVTVLSELYTEIAHSLNTQVYDAEVHRASKRVAAFNRDALERLIPLLSDGYLAAANELADYLRAPMAAITTHKGGTSLLRSASI